LVCKYLATVEEKDLRKYIYEPKNPEEVRSDDPEREDFNREQKLKQELRTYKLRLKGLVNWKANSPRVSAISYTLENIGNAFETANQMGNSPGIIGSNYKNLTNKRQAAKWFAIDPSDPKGAYITTGKNKGKALSESPFPEDWFPQWTRSGDIKNLPRGITYVAGSGVFGGKAKGWWWFPEEGLMPPMSV
jgi:hypothetical protein